MWNLEKEGAEDIYEGLSPGINVENTPSALPSGETKESDGMLCCSTG
jgi:hypothetical protein